MGKHSAPDEALDYFRNMFARAAERDKRRSLDGNCYGFEDGMDGFVVHGAGCSLAGRSWHSSSRDCINYSTWRGWTPDWAKDVSEPALDR